jgi:hypothetical protein
VFQDDLPAVYISRLRATGVITPEMTKATITLGEVEIEVGLTLWKLPSGGSWSRFLCQACGKTARVLRLHEGDLVCCACLTRRGVRCRCEPMSPWQRAEHRIPKLRAMLESEVSLRLKPHLLGTMEKRKRHEAALRRCEFIVAQHDYLGKPGKPRAARKAKANAAGNVDSGELPGS